MSDQFDLVERSPDRGGGFDERDPMQRTKKRVDVLALSANAFASAMTKAFTQATVGGKQLDDVLKSMALRLSSMTVAAAFKPVAKGIAGGLKELLGSLLGIETGSKGGKKSPQDNPRDIISTAFGSIMPFASGGVIGTPTYFPMSSGAMGLAGEAGPEAIMPLTRGNDGRLGVAMNGGGQAPITVHIATPDAASFRRSEAYLTGQIARAVARGQRSL